MAARGSVAGIVLPPKSHGGSGRLMNRANYRQSDQPTRLNNRPTLNVVEVGGDANHRAIKWIPSGRLGVSLKRFQDGAVQSSQRKMLAAQGNWVVVSRIVAEQGSTPLWIRCPQLRRLPSNNDLAIGIDPD